MNLKENMEMNGRVKEISLIKLTQKIIGYIETLTLSKELLLDQISLITMKAKKWKVKFLPL